MIIDRRSVLSLAIYAGEIMLKNGAETYRVEDTIVRICKAYDISNVESFVTPTGIFITVDSENDHQEPITFIKRIKSRTIDLSKVSKVNTFSRSLTDSKNSIEDGIEVLKDIESFPTYPKYIRVFCAGLASAFFGVLLGAGILDFLSSFTISMIVFIIVNYLDQHQANFFIQNALGSAIASALALLFVYFGFGINLDKIIISSIMILLPGVAITNAVRDSISGDLISGTARGVEALITAISIASGVGIIMNLWIHTFGGRF
ncbi:uncharacterized membrane protein YjjP (DUF1212 family) [Anaerosolibacter carboniphilus]|uniref:Uncharacterized membrane protein YjjP (DUF1212 family) n=1 Tax=Anaerosolibacter carboniphilus TaxID=1417629 RepID=A0A841KXD7_9FIRM|nr:threonine/serine exporter family protein [Anaerosolibacter carboniphilus]MBB6214825.1 uncharacterized membrane protein YjjP (DUF1212 family) [Anaerosolibacter carboniphilus]